MADTTTKGTIKFFLEKKGYGFIIVNGEDIFIHSSIVEAAGFNSSDMVAETVVEGVVGTGRNGRTQFLSLARIGMQLADRKPSAGQNSGVASLSRAEIGSIHIGKVDNYQEDRGFGFLEITDTEGLENLFFHLSAVQTSQVPVRGEYFRFEVLAGRKGPAAAYMQRYCRRQVDAKDGKKLFSIKLDGVLIGYEVDSSDEDENVSTESLDTTCLAEARKLLGKTIVPAVSEKHGVKTNVGNSRPKGSAKQKKAA